jgi:hypothetical protein
MSKTGCDCQNRSRQLKIELAIVSEVFSDADRYDKKMREFHPGFHLTRLEKKL